MNRRFMLIGVFLSALVITFLLRDVVERILIEPLAYLWWLLKLYYSAFPQYVLWILLILISYISAISSLMPQVRARKMQKLASITIHGQIADLASWMNKSKRDGIYYKWLIANRLGKNAKEILAQRDGHVVSKSFGKLDGRDWHPPQAIESYFESGLNGSFADYPRPRRWTKPAPTPLDIDPQQVIDYLENELETSHDRNRKGI